jgi:toxin FitB
VNFLIDTNVISELRKGARCDPCVASWYEQIDGESLYLSVLVLGEIRKGVETIRTRDPAQAGVLEKWLVAVAEEFGERVLPITRDVAEEWGRMSATRPLPNPDGLLAATAKVHSMTFVTRDAGVAGLDVVVLNPFKTIRR